MFFKRTYNGFKTYETWAAVVHLTNHEFLSKACKGLSSAALEDFMHYLDDYEINASDTISAIGDLFKVDWSEVSQAL